MPSPYHASLDTPLLSFGGEEWTIRDAVAATTIFGAPGSGKTSGSGRTLARAFLASGMGGLVLCAKNDEADTWRSYAKDAGRADDLVVIDASGEQRFNILDYAAGTLASRGFERNLVELMARMAEASRVADGNSGGGKDGENRYFADNANKWLTHAFPLLLVAEGTLRMSDLNRFLVTTPKNPDEMKTESWRKGYCSQVLFKVGALADAAMKAGHPDSYAVQVVNDHGAFFLTEAANLDSRPRSSIESNVTNLIYPFLTGKLAELFCTTTTVRPDMCRDGKIIIMDLPVLKYGATGAVAQTMFKYLFGISIQNTRVSETTRPVFLYADEAQFFLNSADADSLATARSSKTCIVYLTQDLPTYFAKLGPNARSVAESMLSKFGTWIFHANTSRETNYAASDIIGKVEKYHLGKSISATQNSGDSADQRDGLGGFGGQQGRNISESQSLSAYQDHEIAPDYFATKLRNGSKRHNMKVDAIVIRNAHTWKRTKRHWIKAEFSQV